MGFTVATLETCESETKTVRRGRIIRRSKLCSLKLHHGEIGHLAHLLRPQDLTTTRAYPSQQQENELPFALPGSHIASLFRASTFAAAFVSSFHFLRSASTQVTFSPLLSYLREHNQLTAVGSDSLFLILSPALARP